MTEAVYRLYTGFMSESGYCWECWTSYPSLDQATQGISDFLRGVDSHPELTPIKIVRCRDDDADEAGTLVHQQGLSVEEWGDRVDRGEILI